MSNTLLRLIRHHHLRGLRQNHKLGHSDRDEYRQLRTVAARLLRNRALQQALHDIESRVAAEQGLAQWQLWFYRYVNALNARDRNLKAMRREWADAQHKTAEAAALVRRLADPEYLLGSAMLDLTPADRELLRRVAETIENFPTLVLDDPMHTMGWFPAGKIGRAGDHRALIVRHVAELVGPNINNRYACIAEIVNATSDYTTTRQQVASVLKQDERSRQSRAKQ